MKLSTLLILPLEASSASDVDSCLSGRTGARTGGVLKRLMLVAVRRMPVCQGGGELAVKLPTLLVTTLEALEVTSICPMWSATVTNRCLGASGASTEGAQVVARLMLVAERLMPDCSTRLSMKLPILLVSALEAGGVGSICPRWSALVVDSCLWGRTGASTEEVGVVARLMLVAERRMPVCLAGLAAKLPIMLVTPLEAVGGGGLLREVAPDRADNVRVEVVLGSGLWLAEGAYVVSLAGDVPGSFGRVGSGDSLGGLSIAPPSATPSIPAQQDALMFDVRHLNQHAQQLTTRRCAEFLEYIKQKYVC